jgi:hypothetical protein
MAALVRFHGVYDGLYIALKEFARERRSTPKSDDKCSCC